MKDKPYVFTLPLWTLGLPDHTRLMSKDLYATLGYANANSMGSAITRRLGKQLPPDGRNVSKSNDPKTTKFYFWKLGTLRKYLRDTTIQPRPEKS